MGRVRKGEGVSMVKGVEGVLPKSIPGVEILPFDFLPSRKEFNVDPPNAKHSNSFH
jgi:hypothetical protein